MHTFLVLCLVAITAAQYNYFHPSRLVANDENAEASQENNSGPAVYKKFDKEFFSFSALEGEFDEDQAAQKVVDTITNNLRVIFIKGPENSGLENAALKLAKNSVNQRTAIYVLNKQTDVGDLANKLNGIYRLHNSKPEVHFVKYRTATDAANAQLAIQSQYDTLPGTSSILNSGPAPVLEFASKAAIQLSGEISGEPSNSFIPPITSYLPSSRRI